MAFFCGQELQLFEDKAKPPPRYKREYITFMLDCTK